jgi:hypothetical protein
MSTASDVAAKSSGCRTTLVRFTTRVQPRSHHAFDRQGHLISDQPYRAGSRFTLLAQTGRDGVESREIGSTDQADQTTRLFTFLTVFPTSTQALLSSR